MRNTINETSSFAETEENRPLPTSLSLKSFIYIYPCNKETFQHILNTMIAKNNVRDFRRQSSEYIYHSIYDYFCIGFEEILFQENLSYSTEQPYKYNIKFHFNPNLFAGRGKYMHTTFLNVSDLKKIPAVFQKALKAIIPSINFVLTDGIFQQINYCANLWFNSQKYATEYINLLQQGNAPYQFTKYQDEHCSNVKKNGIIFPYNNFEMLIYLKYPELKAEQKENIFILPEEFRYAKGQLVIEYREFRHKLRQAKSKLNNTEEALVNGSNCFSFQRLCKFLKEIYGTGDFYRFDEASEIITYSRYRSHIKQDLSELLESVKHTHSLDPDVNGYDPDNQKNLMKYFNELKLSPITLPNHSKEIYYPNPLKYLTQESNDLLIYSDTWCKNE